MTRNSGSGRPPTSVITSILMSLILTCLASVSGCQTEPKINDGDLIAVSDTELNELRMQSRRPTIMLDPRSAARFETGHLPGAVNIPLPEIGPGDPRLPADSVIVVYGATYDDPTAVAAAKKLMREGYEEVRLYRGGIDEWVRRGGDLMTTTTGPDSAPAPSPAPGG